jgi:phosphoribosylaminoimidazole-succinocarboxamide synthase
MGERLQLSKNSPLPAEILMTVSEKYAEIAEKITGEKICLSKNPKAEIIEVLDKNYGLII